MPRLADERLELLSNDGILPHQLPGLVWRRDEARKGLGAILLNARLGVARHESWESATRPALVTAHASVTPPGWVQQLPPVVSIHPRTTLDVVEVPHHVRQAPRARVVRLELVTVQIRSASSEVVPSEMGLSTCRQMTTEDDAPQTKASHAVTPHERAHALNRSLRDLRVTAAPGIVRHAHPIGVRAGFASRGKVHVQAVLGAGQFRAAGLRMSRASMGRRATQQCRGDERDDCSCRGSPP